MSNPLVNQVHVDAALSQMSVAYIQKATNFVARRMMPVVPVQFRSDKYFVYDQADFLRDEAQLRAAGTESAGSEYALSTATYTAERYALHKDIADEVRHNADPAIDPERDAVSFLMQKMLIHEDRKFAQDFMKTSVWGADKRGAGNDFANWTVSTTDIIAQIDAWGDIIQKATGNRPNKLLLSRDVYAVVKNNATILESIKYTQTGVITQELLAGLLGLDEVVVADGVYNSAASGATASYKYAIGEDAGFTKSGLLAYVNPTPSILQPSAGYTFSWNPYADAAGGALVKSFYMDQLSSDRVEAEMYWDQKAVSASCGLFFYDAV
tara:strand:- start:303 stop:1274 length:972 start_codon:yes stop_codon:yes gene_type:complete